ncbi:MAG: SurA N-terminal domain-containing protein [Balneola sp.]|nr:SurA N-terminal domain-containing protein [Balneola sp.]MBO6650224.1 SurA N-terminal domain-containing protein [Balneola sp.]MBO6712191.1 SurA N-terminal domain-containing protein [Balneola sp.]MBO6800385.1 SurA N-terminal domain-containing protein [Balneola sp.]MBO6871823.1 SurA N-terminal domain-containing protein [Balneola sp.]
MGLMETLRNGTKYIVIILIVSFGLIWVLADVDFFGAMQAGPNNLGQVNGDDISLQEYNQRVQYYNNLYVQQTGNSMTPEITAIYEQQAWDELVNSRLIEQKMDELGITVTDAELLDMVYGDNPDPIIVQNFSRADGSIDRATIDQVLTNPDFSQQAIALDLQLRQKRRQEKLTNYIAAGVQVTNDQIEAEYMKQNSFADVSYVRFPFADIADEEISVTDADTRDYYNANKEQYKREENYRASVVKFSFLPTADDTATIFQEVEELRSGFANAENDSLFLNRQQSSTPYSATFINKDDVREAYRAVLDLEEGEVTKPFLNAGQVSIIKNVEENRNEIKFVVFSRLIEALQGTIRDADEAARDFQLFADEETDFETEAERAGKEIQSIFATKGNAFISGLGNSQQILTFLERADRGDISRVIELGTDFVVVQLDEKTKEGYRSLEEVKAQVETLVKLEKKKAQAVNNAREALNSNQTVEALASSTGKEVQTAEGIAASSMVLTGAGREPKVIGAIFELEEGETSGVIEGSSAAYVIMVTSKQVPSLDNLDEATKQQIRTRLEGEINQKFGAIWLEQLKQEAEIIDNRSRLIQS